MGNIGSAALALALGLGGCGPAWAPLNARTTPCEIGLTEFQRALDEGATHGSAQIRSDGSVSMQTGPGIEHCATFTSAIRPCRRPTDFVIEYNQVDGEKFYVFIPAHTEYRFNVRAAPNTCQVVRPAP